MAPATELAERAGLAVDDGILVDEYGATSSPGIFAAGDGAHRPDPASGGTRRVEHWTHAQEHGAAVARTMLGVNNSLRARALVLDAPVRRQPAGLREPAGGAEHDGERQHRSARLLGGAAAGGPGCRTRLRRPPRGLPQAPADGHRPRPRRWRGRGGGGRNRGCPSPVSASSWSPSHHGLGGLHRFGGIGGFAVFGKCGWLGRVAQCTGLRRFVQACGPGPPPFRGSEGHRAAGDQCANQPHKHRRDDCLLPQLPSSERLHSADAPSPGPGGAASVLPFQAQREQVQSADSRSVDPYPVQVRGVGDPEAIPQPCHHHRGQSAAVRRRRQGQLAPSRETPQARPHGLTLEVARSHPQFDQNSINRYKSVDSIRAAL